MTYSNRTMRKALAIVRFFETSDLFGDYGVCVVLDDGAGVSYGINQFTHRSGGLGAVVERYLSTGGAVGRHVLQNRLAILLGTDKPSIDSLAKDEVFKKALKAAAVTREMRRAQNEVAFARFLRPAMKVCEAFGFEKALSLAVVYDSITHGGWVKIRDRVNSLKTNERAWITDYVIGRHHWLGSVERLAKTRYRTRFFLEQIARGNWDLALPLTVNGHRLAAAAFEEAAGDEASSAAQDPAFGPRHTVTQVGDSPLNSSTTPPAENAGTPPIQEGSFRNTPAHAGGSDPQQPQSARPPDMLGEAGGSWSSLEKAARVYDRVERIAETALVRSDRAKSLWTTVAGTLWQSAWAVIGAVTHMPRTFWLVAAATAAVLTGLYLYRQIALGRMREARRSDL